MAFTPDAHKSLQSYVAQVLASGVAHQATIRNAILLTGVQHQTLTNRLREFWGNQSYQCPFILDVKPRHGYLSRVLKDGFTPEQFAEWLVAGCSDVAEVVVDRVGRPGLIVRSVTDERAISYDILVPVRSNISGYVHVDDVIPRGLQGKKTAPSAIP